MSEQERTVGKDFVRTVIDEDLAAGRHETVVTRFPPEPNGFLHIGHVKAICIDFGLADEYGGRCHLRFDDTNPETEDPRYVAGIKEDIRWLGFDWGEHEYYASDYFEQLYDWAVLLIEKGLAYVDDSSDEEIREARGTVSEPGRPTPYRDRSVAENLDLFARMRAGEFPDGSKVLRAKIDLAHPNMKMRDPLMYRIRHAHHYRRGDDWCLYPFYDWAHGQSDAIEGITHSLCTLEFDNNRELYDWYVEAIGIDHPPHQYEFARLNVDYLITSKRKLLRLVQGGHVDGWDDPRMPTIAGLRRRGTPPAALRRFVELTGISKSDSRVDLGMLEYAIRDELNHEAPRVMCVLDPLKVVVTTWAEDAVDELEAPYWPHDVPKEGSRTVPFSRELYIERDDFMEDPPKKFFRLAPGREVRLRYGYVIRCDEVIRDENGRVVELRCSHDPDSRGGTTKDGRRVQGTIHWVSAAHAVDVEVRLYDRLFRVPDPGADGRDILDDLNSDSLQLVRAAQAEPGLRDLSPGEHVQFERLGYFFTDEQDSTPGAPVFNRVVTLRDSWAKIAEQQEPSRKSEPNEPKRAESTPGPGDDAEKRRKKSPVEVRAEARGADAELATAYARFQEEHGLSEEDADVLSGDRELAAFFDAAATGHDAAEVAKWVVNDVLRLTKDRELADLPIEPDTLGRFADRVAAGDLHADAASRVFAAMAKEGGDPDTIIESLGLDETLGADAIGAMVDELMAAHADKVDAYRGGHQGLLGFFIGGVMRQAAGKADPQQVQRIVRERLAG
jgi:glutaminyl-tRNA synthetase